MDINYTDTYGNLSLGFFSTGGFVKLLVGFILFAIILYSFMLILKIRVLKDTVDIAENSIIKTIITFNLVVSAGGAILAFILILL